MVEFKKASTCYLPTLHTDFCKKIATSRFDERAGEGWLHHANKTGNSSAQKPKNYTKKKEKSATCGRGKVLANQKKTKRITK